MTTTTDEPIDEQDREPAADEAPEAPADEADADDRRDRKYRARLREAEAERDRFRDALLPWLRAEVERVADQKLTAGSSIWLLPSLDVMEPVGDDLSVDAEKVTAAAERLLAHAPQLGHQVPDFDAGPRSSPSSGASWQQALRGR